MHFSISYKQWEALSIVASVRISFRRHFLFLIPLSCLRRKSLDPIWILEIKMSDSISRRGGYPAATVWRWTVKEFVLEIQRKRENTRFATRKTKQRYIVIMIIISSRILLIINFFGINSPFTVAAVSITTRVPLASLLCVKSIVYRLSLVVLSINFIVDILFL